MKDQSIPISIRQAISNYHKYGARTSSDVSQSLRLETSKGTQTRNNSMEKSNTTTMKITRDPKHQKDQGIVTKYNHNTTKTKEMI